MTDSRYLSHLLSAAVFLWPLNTTGIPTVFQTHRKTVLNHLGWVHLPSKGLAVETAPRRVNGEGIPNDIMLEDFWLHSDVCNKYGGNNGALRQDFRQSTHDRRRNCSAFLFFP